MEGRGQKSGQRVEGRGPKKREKLDNLGREKVRSGKVANWLIRNLQMLEFGAWNLHLIFGSSSAIKKPAQKVDGVVFLQKDQLQQLLGR